MKRGITNRVLRWLLISVLLVIAITHKHENYCLHPKGYHQAPDGSATNPLHFGPKIEHVNLLDPDTSNSVDQ